METFCCVPPSSFPSVVFLRQSDFFALREEQEEEEKGRRRGGRCCGSSGSGVVVELVHGGVSSRSGSLRQWPLLPPSLAAASCLLWLSFFFFSSPSSLPLLLLSTKTPRSLALSTASPPHHRRRNPQAYCQDGENTDTTEQRERQKENFFWSFAGLGRLLLVVWSEGLKLRVCVKGRRRVELLFFSSFSFSSIFCLAVLRCRREPLGRSSLGAETPQSTQTFPPPPAAVCFLELFSL